MDTLARAAQHPPRAAFAAIDIAIERGKKPAPTATAARPTCSACWLGGGARRRGAQSGAAELSRKRRRWSRNEMLKREKGTLGFYVSGHPLDAYREELKRFCNANIATLSNCPTARRSRSAAWSRTSASAPTKTGGKMAFFQLDDPYGRVEVIVRQKALEAVRELLQATCRC